MAVSIIIGTQCPSILLKMEMPKAHPARFRMLMPKMIDIQVSTIYFPGTGLTKNGSGLLFCLFIIFNVFLFPSFCIIPLLLEKINFVTRLAWFFFLKGKFFDVNDLNCTLICAFIYVLSNKTDKEACNSSDFCNSAISYPSI